MLACLATGMNIAIISVIHNTVTAGVALIYTKVVSGKFILIHPSDKILHDIINTICLLNLRKELNNTGKSVSEIIGKCQALMCYRSRNDIVTVETPSKQVKEYYKLLEIDVPAHVDLNKFTASIMQPNM